MALNGRRWRWAERKIYIYKKKERISPCCYLSRPSSSSSSSSSYEAFIETLATEAEEESSIGFHVYSSQAGRGYELINGGAPAGWAHKARFHVDTNKFSLVSLNGLQMVTPTSYALWLANIQALGFDQKVASKCLPLTTSIKCLGKQ